LRERPEDFAQAALRLLHDDALWRQQHEAAMKTREALSWDKVASAWEDHFGLERLS
jgi:glycosyltransferase involved in cell wall biosynthesis